MSPPSKPVCTQIKCLTLFGSGAVQGSTDIREDINREKNMPKFFALLKEVHMTCLQKLLSRTQSLGPLCLWQCFSFSFFVLHLINQNAMMSEVQCPHSISRTCLAQEFGPVFFKNSTFHLSNVESCL